MALVDQLTQSTAIVRSIADSVSLTDLASPAKSGTQNQPIADLVALTDQLAKAVGINRTLTDQVNLSDSFTRLLAHGVLVQDTVAITDGFFRLATYIRSPQDSLALADVLAFQREVHLADLLALADNQNIFNGIITVLLAPISTGRISRGWNGSHGHTENGKIALAVTGVQEEDHEE